MDKGSVKYLIFSTSAIMIAGVILYPIFDLLYTNFITNSKFVYSVGDHVFAPLGMGLCIGVGLWLIDKFSQKDKKKED